MTSRRAFVIACLATVPLAGCTSDADAESGSGSESTETATPASTQESELVVEYHQLNYDEYGYATVSGELRNNTDREMSYVQLSAYMYDGDTRIGEGLWNASNLGAGVRAKFETTPVKYDYRPSGYELRGDATY